MATYILLTEKLEKEGSIIRGKDKLVEAACMQIRQMKRHEKTLGRMLHSLFPKKDYLTPEFGQVLKTLNDVRNKLAHDFLISPFLRTKRGRQREVKTLSHNTEIYRNLARTSMVTTEKTLNRLGPKKLDIKHLFRQMDAALNR